MYLTVGGRVPSSADGTAKLMLSEERMPGILSVDKSFVGGAGGMLCDRRQYDTRKDVQGYITARKWLSRANEQELQWYLYSREK